MHLFDGMRTIWAAITQKLAASRRASEFTCGKCDQNERCGLPPHTDCVVKAAQIARDGEFSRAPPEYYKAVWPR